MIGYHYTSYKNWRRIRKQGLIPYFIDHEELSGLFDEPVFGIWLWSKRFKGISHLGSMIDRLIHLEDTKIVLLKVNYHKSDVLKCNRCSIDLTHKGTMGDWLYHQEKSSIITTKIPPKDIRFIGMIDFLKLPLDNKAKINYNEIITIIKGVRNKCLNLRKRILRFG